MKNLLFISLGLVLISFFVGCHKDHSASIDGRVLELGTNKPLPNKMVYIFGTISEFLGSYSEYPIDTIFSDNNGNYHWEIADKQEGLDIMAIDPLYFSESILTINEGKNKNKDLYLQPKAWIRYHVKNTMPFDDNDYIKTSFLDFPLFGKYIDDLKTVQKRGNQKTYAYWYVTKNNIQTKYTDSIFVKGLDTLDYNINY